MKDLTKGYYNGDNCPSCKKGNIEIRETDKSGAKATYAQCSKCSWNSMR